MNASFKHLLLSITLLLLFASTHTHCMLTNKLAKNKCFLFIKTKIHNKPINWNEFEPELTHVATRLYKLESDTRDLKNQLDATRKSLGASLDASKKSLEKMQEFSYATRSDIDILEKRIGKLEFEIETLTYKVLLCNLKKLNKQSEIKTYTKPATQEDLEKHCNRSPAEPFDEEVMYWEPMTPEMIEKFCQSLAITLEGHERRMRDGDKL